MTDELVSLRPASLDDAAFVAALGREDSLEVGEPPTSTTEQVAREWQTPGFDAARDARLAILAGEPVGYGWVWSDGDTLHAGGFTTKHARGRGVATALLGWALEEARSRDARLVYAGGNAQRHDAEKLLRDHGFSYERTFIRMIHHRPAEIADPVWPDGVALRALEGDDLVEALCAGYDESFVDHWNFHPADREEWRHLLSQEDPSLWFVAFSGEQVAGFNRCRVLRYPGGARGLLGPIGTTRAFRRIGLGRALLRHGVRALARAGADHVALGVDAINPTGAVRLYETDGFQRATSFQMFKLER